MSKITPQQKLISVNDHFGNPMLAKQQGTTIEIFDLIELSPSVTNYEFFKNVNSKKFPFTNLQEGKLQPQESFILSYAYLTLITTVTATGEVTDMRRLSLSNDPAMLMGTLEQQIENSIVVKQLPLKSFIPEFNQSATNESDSVYKFLTKIALLPLLNFQTNLKFSPDFVTIPALSTVYLSVTLGGPGAIFSPKNNF